MSDSSEDTHSVEDAQNLNSVESDRDVEHTKLTADKKTDSQLEIPCVLDVEEHLTAVPHHIGKTSTPLAQSSDSLLSFDEEDLPPAFNTGTSGSFIFSPLDDFLSAPAYSESTSIPHSSHTATDFMNIADFVEQEKSEKDKQIERLTNDNGNLRRENDALRNELDVKSKEVSDLQNQLTTTKNDYDAIRTTLNDQLRDFIQTSETDKTTIRDLTSSLDTLRTKLTEEESKSKDLEIRMSILENKTREESLKTDTDETYMRPSDVPRTISKYQIGEIIGRGFNSRVFRGLDSEQGSVVAIKQIKKSVIDPSKQHTITEEISLMKSLQNPGIVKFVESIEMHNSYFFVLEYVEGGSLYKSMRKFGNFPESLAGLYISQALSALKYLHSMNIVHRDIKSDNMLLTKEGKIKLSDFGSSRVTKEDKALTDPVGGTPYWLAPEVIRLEGTSQYSDIWSIACTTLELIQGFPPYYDLSPMTAIYTISEATSVPLPEDISANCKDFLERCFVKEPTKRPTAEQLLGHPWMIQCRKESGPSLSEVAATLRSHSASTRKPLLRAPSIRNTLNTSGSDEEVTKLKVTLEGVKKQLEETQNENLVLRKQLSQLLIQSPTMPNRPTRSVTPPTEIPPTAYAPVPTPQTVFAPPNTHYSAPPIPTTPIPSPYLTTSPTPPKTSPIQSPSASRLNNNPLSSAPPSHSLPPENPHFSQLGSQTNFGYTAPSPVQSPPPTTTTTKPTYHVTPVAQWPLPQGWDMSFDKGGRPYFINHANRSTTYRDPRTGQIPQPVQSPSAPREHPQHARQLHQSSSFSGYPPEVQQMILQRQQQQKSQAAPYMQPVVPAKNQPVVVENKRESVEMAASNMAFGVYRGKCSSPCACARYVAGGADMTCKGCGHFPARHEILGKPGDEPVKSDKKDKKEKKEKKDKKEKKKSSFF